jgi:hypothetical protein
MSSILNQIVFKHNVILYDAFQISNNTKLGNIFEFF